VTILAKSLRRIWAAKNRVPHQTGWGTCGSVQNTTKKTILVGSMYETANALTGFARQTAPTVLPILWNIFR